jgi:multiple sugar transport system permease protein
MISYILITSFIGAFKSYEALVGVFSAAGVSEAIIGERTTVVGFTYDMIGLYGGDYYSRGAAAAVILFVIIMFFTLINQFVSRKSVHY